MKPKTMFLLCVLTELQRRTTVRAEEGTASANYLGQNAPLEAVTNWPDIFKTIEVFELAVAVPEHMVVDDYADSARIFVNETLKGKLPEWAVSDEPVVFDVVDLVPPSAQTIERLFEMIEEHGVVTVNSIKRQHRTKRKDRNAEKPKSIDDDEFFGEDFEGDDGGPLPVE